MILAGVAVRDVDALSKIPHRIGLHSDLEDSWKSLYCMLLENQYSINYSNYIQRYSELSSAM